MVIQRHKHGLVVDFKSDQPFLGMRPDLAIPDDVDRAEEHQELELHVWMCLECQRDEHEDKSSEDEYRVVQHCKLASLQ